MTPLLCDPTKFLAATLSREGRPYLFAQKGPNTFDCSGLVTWSIWTAGGVDLRRTFAASTMWERFEPCQRPAPGELALALYGFPADPPVVDHVMVVMPDGRVYGACGGDRGTTTLAIAKLRGAKVQYRSGPDYRPDFLGYRRLAFKDALHG